MTADAGLSFELTAEQRSLRELAHDFAEEEIRPRAAEYDENQTHPTDVLERAHALGLMNLHVPRACGGPALGLLEGALIAEELYWGCAGIGTALTCNGLGGGPLIAAGTAERRRRGLSALLERPIVGAVGLTEPDAGSDVARLETRAVRKEGEYV